MAAAEQGSASSNEDRGLLDSNGGRGCRRPVMELPMTAPSLGLAIRAQCVLRGPPENKLNYKRQARAQAASGRVLKSDRVVPYLSSPYSE